MCFNTYLRNGTVPYFAEMGDEDNEDDQEEAIDAAEESDSESDAQDTKTGLAQVMGDDQDED